jgi:DNA-3-methyladenine glycosylase II
VLDDGMTASGVADPAAREFLRKADPILARVIDAHPGLRPRAWMDDLPPLDAFGTLIFQVVGQQLSVASTRAIVYGIEELFCGRRRRRSCLRPIPRCFVRPASPPAKVRRFGRSRSDLSTEA